MTYESSVQVKCDGAEIGTIHINVDEDDNIIGISVRDEDGATALALDVAEALELIGKLTTAVAVAVQA